jgi:filamentous hemagglutinin
VFALALLQSGAASAAFAIGDTKSLSSNMNLFLHTVLGCGVGAIKQDSSEGCAPGALGALVAKVWANENGAQIRAESATDADADKTLLDLSTFAGTIAGCIVGGPVGCDTGGMTGKNAVAENYLNNTQWKQLSDRLKSCTTEAECAQVRKEFVELHAKQDAALREACKDLNSHACRTKIAEAQVGSMTQKDLVMSGLLPDYYLGGSDWNANANRYAKQAFLSDLKAECARNARCDAKKEESLKKLGSAALDFVPVIGDIKAFVEAETPFDYLLATLGIAGPAGDSIAKALREGRALYKAGDMTGATAKLDEARNIKEVNLANQVSPSNSGHLNKTKLGKSEMVVDTPTGSQRLTISDVVANGDKYGEKTEALVNDVLKSDPSIKVLDGTKYGSNNGLDHVVQYVDPQTGKTMTMVIDSKQLAINGTTNLSSTAAGSAELGKNVMQLSDESLTIISARLPDNSPAKTALDQAQKNGTLVKAVAYVDKTTGQLKIVPVTVPNAK